MMFAYSEEFQLGRDAFDNLDKWAGRVTETVYICGNGPSLNSVLHKIPRDSFSLALNGAIMLDYPFSAWTVYCSNAPFWPWFHEAPLREDTLVLFGNALADRRAHYWYGLHDGAPLTWGAACGERTVAGCAIELMYWAHWREMHKWDEVGISLYPRIVLAGVDMLGSGHASGETGMQTGTWGQRDALLQVIRAVQNAGVVVQSLTETELHLEVVDA